MSSTGRQRRVKNLCTCTYMCNNLAKTLSLMAACLIVYSIFLCFDPFYGNTMYKAYAVAILSMLSGAAVVHNIYKPDLVRSVLNDPHWHLKRALKHATRYAEHPNSQGRTQGRAQNTMRAH